MLPIFGGMEGRADTIATSAESGDAECFTIASAATTFYGLESY